MEEPTTEPPLGYGLLKSLESHWICALTLCISTISGLF
jgi:hypothetical protein